MREIDMSREAVTARLKLVSQLRRLCLSLQTAKIKSPSATKHQQQAPNTPERKSE
jgi:hypothetical protein